MSVMSNGNTDQLKVCLRLILYGSHLNCVAVKAIVMLESKSTLNRFRKIFYFSSNLLE